MEVLDQLEEYMIYMDELGFGGLALEESPFRLTMPMGPTAVPALVEPGASALQNQMPRAKLAPTAEPARAQPRAETPNLLSIMQTVDALGTQSDTHAQVAAIKGANATEVLKNLYLAFHQCQACALCTTRNRFVFGEGPANARLMFVGEYPTRVDEATGRPFMDAAGQLLNNMIKAMGLTRADVFITNAVKCAPPDRMPLPDELDTCAPVLERQIEAVNPQFIVALGPTALRFFRGEGVSLVRARGQLFPWKQHQVMPTHHPEYILRNPRAKRDVWEDLQKVMAML